MMAATARTVSLGARRYLSLCASHGVSEAALLASLTADHDCPSNIATNIGNYLSGVTQDCRSNCKQLLVDFADKRLGERIDETFFDLAWHPMMVIDEFAKDNRIYAGLLTNNCGDFVYIVEKPAGSDPAPGLRVRKLSIRREGSNIFKVVIGGDGGDVYVGFATFATNTVYIIAFDQSKHADILMFILRPVTEGKLEPATFVGVQTCTLPRTGARIAYAAARRTLLIRQDAFEKMTADWHEGKAVELSEPLREWLAGSGLTERPGFVVDLDAHVEIEE